MRLAGSAAILFPLAVAIPVDSSEAANANSNRAIFQCAIGRKTVSVTSRGGTLIYRFGVPGRAEIAISGDANSGNIFYRKARYSGMEYQIRFVRGPYSYIVYSLEGNGQTGALPTSGVVVLKGTRDVSRLSCREHAVIDWRFDFTAFPQDSETYTAM